MTTYTQTKIAQSRWALPVTAVYAVVVCIASGAIAQGLWVQMLLLALSAVLMAELNKVHNLVRIYSQAVPCAFLIMVAMAAPLLATPATAVTGISLIVFYLCFFQAYQAPTAAGWIFYAFVALGIASMAFVHVLFFLPVLWILMATNVMAFNSRTFLATLLGIALPYWFAAAYYIHAGDIGYFSRHFTELIRLDSVFNLALLDEHRIITLAFVFLLAAIGGLHFLAYSYQDKIRTRMIFETFITLDMLCLALIVILPQYSDPLLAMAIVTTAPLIGHYSALSHTRISNICFMALIALALIITLYNLWMPLTIFS